MKTRKLAIACPACGSGETVYTCTPNCCFNHVCVECGTTFEPVTASAGGFIQGIEPPEGPFDASDPAAACALCDAPKVYMTEDGAPVCGACGARLTLELTEVHPA